MIGLKTKQKNSNVLGSNVSSSTITVDKSWYLEYRILLYRTLSGGESGRSKVGKVDGPSKVDGAAESRRSFDGKWTVFRRIVDGPKVPNLQP